MDSFINNNISIVEFKEKSEIYCREYPFWGFKGFSGQMQFNQYVNNINDEKKTEILKAAIVKPDSIDDAKEKINKLYYYLINLKHGSKIPKSIPRTVQYYLLSYFWELQDLGKWPVYYMSTKKTLLKLGFPLDSFELPGEEYEYFVRTLEEIKNLYTKNGYNLGEYPFWTIEHILWNQFRKNISVSTSDDTIRKKKKSGEKVLKSEFGEWIPPIISDLVELSMNKKTEWSQRTNIKPDKAFEKKLRYAFVLLGYETTELGQGTGREPDGIAKSVDVADGDYAIIYDAKAREEKFSLGTNDREILEYIQRKKEELRRERIGKLYFVIISSDFSEKGSDINMARELYRKTQVPISFLRAEDLLFIVENKLQDFKIDHKQLEYLFLETERITREKIVSDLGLV